MAINLNITDLDDGGASIPYVAPLRLSAQTPTTLNTSGTSNVDVWRDTATTGLYGARSVFASTIDATPYEYLSWLMVTLRYGFPNSGVTSYLTGGIIVIFEDSSGNYAGWRIYGNGVVGYDAGDRYSYFCSYSNSGYFLVKRTHTPDYSSGTIDWTDLVAAEFYADTTATNGSLGFGNLKGVNQAEITGSGETMGDISDYYDSNFSRYHFLKAPPSFSGASQVQYAVRHGFDIGDGTTTTSFTDSDLYVGLTNPQDFQDDGFITTGFLLKQPDNRLIRTRANATLTLSNFSISSAGQYEVVNEGTTNFSNGNIIRANSVDAQGSATYASMILDSCQEFKVDLTTAITNASYIGQPASGVGLVIEDVAGDYSGLDVSFDDNLGNDISLGSGGAGTYDLSGVTVASGYTLKVHNNSTTNAVTVILPSDITTNTTTDGGAISIQSPATTYTLQLPNIDDGSRFQIYNVTQDTELTNTTTTGGLGVNVTYTQSTDYDSGDIGRYRVTYQNGLNAMESIEGSFTFTSTTTINAIPIEQTPQEQYEFFGVDGAGITEFLWDGGNVEIDVTDSDNQTSIQRIGAWYYYYITTAIGINEAFGALSWENLNSIKIVTSKVSVTIDNKKTEPLMLSGGRMYHDDGTTVISATSNSVQVDYDPVYTIETGVSGLTPLESEKLLSLNTDGLATEIQVDGLNDFNPASDTVSHVTLVDQVTRTVLTDTTTVNTDMRGTDGANTVEPDNIGIGGIKAKTDGLPVDTTAEINSIKKNTNLIPATI